MWGRALMITGFLVVAFSVLLSIYLFVTRQTSWMGIDLAYASLVMPMIGVFGLVAGGYVYYRRTPIKTTERSQSAKTYNHAQSIPQSGGGLTSRVCPRCGKLVQDDAAVFCPYCAMSLQPSLSPRMPAGRTGFPIAAGILTIIGACLSIAIGLLGLTAVSLSFLYDRSIGHPFLLELLFLTIFGILGFAFGISGGIFFIKRTHFTFAVIGVSLLLVSAVVAVVAFWLTAHGAEVFVFLLGVPMIILSTLGIIFVSVAKGEFQ